MTRKSDPTIADVYEGLGELNGKVDVILKTLPAHDRRLRKLEVGAVKMLVLLSTVIAIGGYLGNLLIHKLIGS